MKLTNSALHENANCDFLNFKTFHISKMHIPSVHPLQRSPFAGGSDLFFQARTAGLHQMISPCTTKAPAGFGFIENIIAIQNECSYKHNITFLTLITLVLYIPHLYEQSTRSKNIQVIIIILKEAKRGFVPKPSEPLMGAF